MRIVGGKYCSDLLCEITSYICHFPLCIGKSDRQFPVVVRLFLAFQTFLLVSRVYTLSSCLLILFIFLRFFFSGFGFSTATPPESINADFMPRSTPAIRAPLSVSAFGWVRLYSSSVAWTLKDAKYLSPCCDITTPFIFPINRSRSVIFTQPRLGTLRY